MALDSWHGGESFLHKGGANRRDRRPTTGPRPFRSLTTMPAPNISRKAASRDRGLTQTAPTSRSVDESSGRKARAQLLDSVVHRSRMSAAPHRPLFLDLLKVAHGIGPGREARHPRQDLGAVAGGHQEVLPEC